MKDVANTCIVVPSQLAREGWRRLLEGTTFELMAAIGSVAQLQELTSNADGVGAAVELVLIDLPADVDDVRETVRKAREMLPEARLVVFCAEVGPEMLSASFAAGADGFLHKDISYDAMLESLRLVMLGEKVFPSRLLSEIVSGMAGGTRQYALAGNRRNLSGREVEILRCLVAGYSNKMIGNRLNITETTVKVHLKSILRKIGAANRTQAAIWAVGQGVVGIDSEAPERRPRLIAGAG